MKKFLLTLSIISSLASGYSANQVWRVPTPAGLPAWGTLKAPTTQVFNFGLPSNSNSYAYYTFTISAATVGAGSTYTNNGKTCTVVYAVTSATTITAYCTGAPAASGTLTYASGSPSGNLTFSAQSSGGTYVLPTSPSPIYIRVRMVGSGGNGGGSGTGSFGVCSNGLASTFGSSLLTANQGSEGTSGAFTIVSGGTVTINSPAITVLAVTGGTGGGGQWTSGTTTETAGGYGGASPFGGAGAGAASSAGSNGAPGSGSGGGGAGCGAVASCFSGTGGGAGGFLVAQINSPSATYTFQVGANGVQSCGTGTSGSNAGSGGGGQIVVEEYYQ